MTAVHDLTDQQLAFLNSVDSPTIANAIERLKTRPLTDGFIGGAVQCTFPELGPMVGRALTVTMRNPVDRTASREGYWRMWEGLEAMAGPVVLMIADESGTPQRVAYAGEIMSRLARRLGAVGMVTDGALRDLVEVRALGFHYSCVSGSLMRTSRSPRLATDRSRRARLQTGDLVHGGRQWNRFGSLGDTRRAARRRRESRHRGGRRYGLYRRR